MELNSPRWNVKRWESPSLLFVMTPGKSEKNEILSIYGTLGKAHGGDARRTRVETFEEWSAAAGGRIQVLVR